MVPYRKAERIRETVSTTGTGLVVNLDGATLQCRSFKAGLLTPFGEGSAGHQVRAPYVLLSGDGTSWEKGICTVTAGTPDTLSRDTIEFSTNSNARIDLIGVSKAFVFEPAMLGFFNQVTVQSEGAAIFQVQNFISATPGSYGNLSVRNAEGTIRSPAYLTSGLTIGGVTAYGWDETDADWALGASIQFQTSENWTHTARGTRMVFSITPNGTVDNFDAFIVWNDGGLSSGGLPSTGLGTINVDGVSINNSGVVTVASLANDLPPFVNAGTWSATAAYAQNDIVRHAAGWYIAKHPILAPVGVGATPTVDGHGSTFGNSITLAPALTTTLTNDTILAFVYIPDTSVHVNSVVAASGVPGGFTRRTRAANGLEVWSGFAAAPLAGVLITATLSGSTYASIAVMGVNGASNVPFDPNVLLPYTNETAQTVAITTTDALDLLLYVCGDTGTFSSIGTPSGWTSQEYANFGPANLRVATLGVSSTESALSVTSALSDSHTPIAIGDALTGSVDVNLPPESDTTNWAELATIDSAGLDAAFGSTEGQILQRGSAGWQVLAPGSVGQVLTSGGAAALNSWAAVADTDVDTGITQLTGDVTAGPGSGSQVATIAGHAVTNAKAAQMVAHTFKGNNTGSTADAIDLTAAQLTAELSVIVGDSGSGGTKGLMPAPASGDHAAGKYADAGGGFSVPAGTGLPSSLTSAHLLVGNGSNLATDVAVSGDLTLANTGAFTIASHAVTNAKAAQMVAHTFKGNNTASTADAIDLTATQLTAELNVVVGDSGSGGTKGLMPAPAAGDAAAGKFANAAGGWSVPAGGLSATLTSAHILVGNGSNVATDVAASGDLTLANTGAFTLGNSGATAGSYTFPNLTVDAKGRVTAITGGSGAGSTGYPAGTLPTIVQVAHNTGANGATFGVAPTSGNLLVAFNFNNSVNGAASGWTLQVQQGSGNDYGSILTKVAGGSESTTQTPMLSANSTAGTVIYELSGANSIVPFIAGASQVEGASRLTLPVIQNNFANCIGLSVLSVYTAVTIDKPYNTGTQDVYDNTGNHRLYAGHTDLSQSPTAGVFAQLSGTGSYKSATCLVSS